MSVAYALAPRAQRILEIPSGNSREVVHDVERLVNQGPRTEDIRHNAARFSSSQGLIEAVHDPGGFYTRVTVQAPGKTPIPWLALQVYREKRNREYRLGTEFAAPTGILAVRATVEGVADNLSEQRERSPEILEGITVQAIGSVGIPGEDNYVSGSSVIQLRKPGREIPDVLEYLALAADQLLPGTLGLNPKDELARQIGWEGYWTSAQAWCEALQRDGALEAAQYCMRGLGIHGPMPEY
jgi:hypothetical protein